MDFTREQEQAITSGSGNILVSAGAGAGKTRVLVTRICRMIRDRENPVSAEEILVLTFTKAAAKEMKERISLELKERLEEDPENRYLRRQIRAVRHADISTIHSFCHHLIRTHFNELGIDPSFRIGEDAELKPLKQEAMETLLEERYQAGEQSFLDLVEAYAPGRDDLALEKIIDRIYTFVRGFPDAGGWFAGMEKEMESMMTPEGLEQSRVIRILYGLAGRQLAFCRKSLERALRITEDTEGPDQVRECLARELELTDHLLELQDYSSLQAGLAEAVLPAYPRKAGKMKEWVPFDEVKKAHELLKNTLNGLMESAFAKDPERIIRELEKMYPMYRECISLVQRFGEIYLAGKKEKNIYDFNDLEHFTLKLLVDSYGEDGLPVPSEEAGRIAGRYKAVFVDEYQDTSLIQETIINLLTESGKGSLFVVGDVKQSIYRFRQARPDLFLERYHRYEEGEGLKIELRDNFRSSPDVLTFCNRFFSCWMKEDFGGIDYNDRIKLVPGAGGPMAQKHFPQEAMLLIRDSEDEEREFDSILAEAAMLADRIGRLHHEEGYKYDDIVILLRSIKDSGQLIADYLETRGIPAVCGSETGYFQTREIRVILNLLSVIDNLYQDIPMASVMLSGIGGFTGEDLARLKVLTDSSCRSVYSLYDLMKIYRETGEDEALREKISRFLDMLNDFRKKRQEMLLHELIWEICRKTGFYRQVLAMPRGEKRIGNLMMLIQQAKNYEKNVYKGLFYFIRHMEELRTYEVEPGDNSMEDSSQAAVKIMTIHKSKGLEFPVVFVSRLAKQFRKQDASDKVLLHPGLGMGMDVFHPAERAFTSSVIKNVIKDRLLKEGMEEELRILYVAMTRARERLIMTSVVDGKMMEKAEKGEDFLPAPEKARSFLDWVLPVLRENGWEGCRKVRMEDLEEGMGSSVSRSRITLSGMMEEAEARPVDLTPVREAFGRTYPYKYCVGWKRKFSVSELKKLAMERLEGEEVPFLETFAAGEEEEPVPAFLEKKEEETAGGTAYGTLVHKVMELLDFRLITDRKTFEEEFARTADTLDGALTGLENRVAAGAAAFLFSEEGEVFREMARKNRLYKELPFTAGLDASLVYPGSEEGERIVLQGIVDLCGETEDGLWLLDYKTDRIGPGEESVLLDRYETQMLYYRLALEQMTGRKVTRSIIYSFALKKIIECDR